MLKAKHKNIQHVLSLLYMTEILMHVLLHVVLDKAFFEVVIAHISHFM